MDACGRLAPKTRGTKERGIQLRRGRRKEEAEEMKEADSCAAGTILLLTPLLTRFREGRQKEAVWPDGALPE